MYQIEVNKNKGIEKKEDEETNNEPEYQPFYKNWRCWLISMLVIVCSGIGTWILYDDKNLPKDVIFLLGAAFPVLFKKFKASVESGEVILGNKYQSYFDV
jgi:hypothetical protein